MRWLVLGNLTPAVSAALTRHGHKVSVPADIGLSDESTAFEVLITAHAKQLDVLTTLPEIIAAPFAQQIKFDRSLVHLQLPGGDIEQDDAIDRLFKRYKRLTPGRLYTVTETRVKVRQLPTPVH